MKKVLSLILVLAFLFALLCTPQAAAVAADTTGLGTSSGNNELSSALPDRSSWQLTSAELNAPTEELVRSILESPYLLDLFHSNSSDNDPYASIITYFNGLSELERREDSATAMLAHLEELTLSKTEWDSLEQLYLTVLLTEPVYANRLTNTEKETYDLLVAIHDAQIKAEATGESTRYLDGFKLGKVEYTRSSTNGYTTSGTIVPLYTAQSDFTNAEKQSTAHATATKYGVAILDYATSKYNCHSYAWHSSLTSNEFWVNYTDMYVNDDHCTQTSTPTVGSLVVYYGANNRILHSAVVTSINGSSIMCTSKWGQDGLFTHRIDNVPTSYCNAGTPDYRYYTYTRYHSGTFVSNNSATHSRTCTICGLVQTEPHVANPKTGNCISCGQKGPFSNVRG